MEFDDKKFRPNSHKFKRELMAKPESPTEPTLVKKKKSGKILSSLIAEDSDSISDYLIFDLLIPAIKGVLFDGATGALDLLLYGRNRGGRDRRSRTRSPRGESYSYRDYSAESTRNASAPRSRSSYMPEDIFFPDKELEDGSIQYGYHKANLVLDQLCEELGQYKRPIKLSTLYDYAEITSKNHYTDEYYGWFDLEGFYITREPNGAVLHLPRCQQLPRD